MLEVLQPYVVTLWCVLSVGGLLLIQLLVADIVGLSNGHVPGTTVEESHASLQFRTMRAHANTNESIASFILLAIGGIAFGANPQWLNWLASLYLGSRVAHTFCYWSGWGIARSIAFVVSLIALFGMLVIGIYAGL